MHEDDVAFRHDIGVFIDEITRQSAAESHKNDANWLYSRLRSINAMGIALGANHKFLEYISAENELYELHGQEFYFSGTIIRIVYSSEHLMTVYNNSVKISKNIQSKGRVSGPAVFDFIPFAILQNCIKYSPRGMQIAINTFDSDHQAHAEFVSWGPRIEPAEQESIFLRDYRGINALKTHVPGRGIGLYHARQAIRDLFGGDISLSWREAGGLDLNNIPYAQHRFKISVPLD